MLNGFRVMRVARRAYGYSQCGNAGDISHGQDLEHLRMPFRINIISNHYNSSCFAGCMYSNINPHNVWMCFCDERLQMIIGDRNNQF